MYLPSTEFQEVEPLTNLLVYDLHNDLPSYVIKNVIDNLHALGIRCTLKHDLFNRKLLITFPKMPSVNDLVGLGIIIGKSMHEKPSSNIKTS